MVNVGNSRKDVICFQECVFRRVLVCFLETIKYRVFLNINTAVSCSPVWVEETLNTTQSTNPYYLVRWCGSYRISARPQRENLSRFTCRNYHVQLDAASTVVVYQIYHRSIFYNVWPVIKSIYIQGNPKPHSFM